MLRLCALAAVAAIAVGFPARAQSSQGRLSVGAGTATDVSGLTSRAVTISPSVTFALTPTATFAISGAGTRFGSGAWSALGAAAVSGRRAKGRIATTFDGGASYTTTSYRLAYASGDAIPAIEIGLGPIQAFVGGHATFASLSNASSPIDAPLGQLPTTREPTRVFRSGMSAVGGLGARVVTGNGAAITASAREERGTVAGAPQIDRTASMSVSRGRISVGASVGGRIRDDVYSGIGSGAATVEISDGIALSAGGGRYVANPLSGAAAGSYATISAVVRLGRSQRSGRAAFPAVEGIGAPASGITRLSIKVAPASRVELAGDFTNWAFVDARAAANGVWYVDLRIPPGEYRYAFRVDGRTWRIPDGIPAATDDFGGVSAWLVVRPTAGRAGQ